jgi:hypothetical protein
MISKPGASSDGMRPHPSAVTRLVVGKRDAGTLRNQFDGIPCHRDVYSHWTRADM